MMQPPALIKTDDLSTLTYILGVRRCWHLLATNGYPLETIDKPHINFHFADNGCSSSSISGYTQDGLYFTVATKLDAIPEGHRSGMRLSTVDEPGIYVIMDELRVDGEWTLLYDNPSYGDNPR